MTIDISPLTRQATDWPSANCCSGFRESSCICQPMERFLRSLIGNPDKHLTGEQRKICLDEIGAVEGYDRKEHEKDTDGELAGRTLSAWFDYCRDKGMM